MTVTETLGAKIAATRFEDLPREVVATAREVVLDGMSNMLAGSREPMAPIVSDYVRSLGGPEEATAVGCGFRTHPVNAAFINGVLCHSMDFELMWYPATHPTGTTLPAILALAEAQDLPPREVVAAIAVSFEVQGRLRLATVSTGIAEPEGIHPPGLVGVFGAAAGCARLLRLSEQQTRWALGISGSRIGGLSANSGTMTKATHSGNAARMGLEAALLAQRGFTASEDIFGAKRGFNHVLYDNALDMTKLVEGFGKPYRMVDPGLIVKRFPTQYTTHWVINAALRIRERGAVAVDDIDRVVIEAAADNPALGRPNPATGLDGKFSAEYAVAVALLDGKVVIDSFRDERRFAPDVVALLPRMEAKPVAGIHALDFADTWGRVTVWTKDGRCLSERIERPPGIWDNPLSWEGRLEKYRDCVSRVMSPAEADEMQALIECFDQLDSVRPLMRLAAGRGGAA